MSDEEKKAIDKLEELNRENTRQHELIGNIHQKWEDKIKAKVKEISKEWAEGELDGEWYEFMKYHLESLLGKE